MSRTPKTNIKPGVYVWIKCEVKPGPFSNERMVRAVSWGGQEWVGFSPVSELKKPIATGSTFIRALILGVHEDRFDARLPGAALASTVFEDKISNAQVA